MRQFKKIQVYKNFPIVNMRKGPKKCAQYCILSDTYTLYGVRTIQPPVNLMLIWNTVDTPISFIVWCNNALRLHGTLEVLCLSTNPINIYLKPKLSLQIMNKKDFLSPMLLFYWEKTFSSGNFMKRQEN